MAAFLRAWGRECRWQGVASLIGDRLHRLWILRMLRFCLETTDCRLLTDLVRMADRVRSPTLEEVLRSQQVACSRLSTLQGWAGLGARMGELGPEDGRTVPGAREVLEPGDGRLLERQARRLAPTA